MANRVSLEEPWDFRADLERAMQRSGNGATPEAVVAEPIDREDAMSRDRLYRFMLTAADICAVLLAMTFAVHIVGGGVVDVSLLLGAPVVLVFVSKIAGLYDRDELVLRKGTTHEIPALFHHSTVFAFFFWLFSGELVNAHFGPYEALALWASLFSLTVLLRFAARLGARKLTPVERLLLVGDAGTYLRLSDKLELGHVPARLVGRMSLLRTSRVGTKERALEEASLRSMVRTLDVHRLLVVPNQSSPETTLDIVRLSKQMGMRVSIIPQVMDVVGNAVVLDDVRGMTLLGVRRFELSRSSRFIKRSMDVVGGIVGLTLLSPFFVLLAILIKLDSPGPVFFRQGRVGRDGMGFRIYKFRSMEIDAEARKAELLAQGHRGGLFKIKDDPRVTRIGRVLRRTSLDELPQLINVIRGEMSLVGPRPLIDSEDVAITGYDRDRLRLTPGMTGPWQLMGSRVPLREMVKLDYLYVTNWSLMEDVAILLRTVRHMALRKGL